MDYKEITISVPEDYSFCHLSGVVPEKGIRHVSLVAIINEIHTFITGHGHIEFDYNPKKFINYIDWLEDRLTNNWYINKDEDEYGDRVKILGLLVLKEAKDWLKNHENWINQ